ncbi:MAG: transcriptional regulator [Lyngbya sp.]|nr:transcriptional regulator [Lyngbya sp.]
MQEIQVPTSDSYHDYLIESLKDSEEAAGYIEVALEEACDEPYLLRKVLKNVMEARMKMNNLSESAKQNYEKLDQALAESGGSEIFTFVELLNALGFELSVKVKE